MIARYTIKQVVEATGIEECEIRFFEQVFREFLTFSQLSLDKNEFTQDHIDILCRIKQLIHGEGRSINEVKRDLKAAVGRDGALLETTGAETTSATAPAVARTSRRHARVIAVTSGKGGVGKTVVTVNLAIALAQMGQRVAIFDADLGLANVHILMGVKPRFNVRHLVEDNFTLEDVLTEGPHGVKIISGGQGVRELANLTRHQRRAVLRQIDRLEREVDLLLVDTGAGISENVLRFTAYADEVMVVTTPNIASAADGYSIIKIILEMEPHSKIGLVANMAKNMYHSKNIFNRVNAATRKYLHYTLGDLGHVVYDPRVEAASQARQPVQLLYPQSEAAKCMRGIADTILNTEVFVNQRKESAFGDMVGALKRSLAGV